MRDVSKVANWMLTKLPASESSDFGAQDLATTFRALDDLASAADAAAKTWPVWELEVRNVCVFFFWANVQKTVSDLNSRNPCQIRVNFILKLIYPEVQEIFLSSANLVDLQVCKDLAMSLRSQAISKLVQLPHP